MAEAFARGTDAPPDESVVAAIDAIRELGRARRLGRFVRRRPGGPRGSVRLARRASGGGAGNTRPRPGNSGPSRTSRPTSPP